MISKIAKIFFILLSVVFLVYLAWPAPLFPKTLWDFQSSTEGADRESPLRRGYYTNHTREQLMSHYKREFGWGITLNYPPEEAQTLIRDQTQSTFLEEIVHPMHESLFVAGNEVRSNSPFEINGKNDVVKVIVKYVDSNIILRLFVGILTLGLVWVVSNEYINLCKKY
jgi:hypothetical protein